jgi:hypothetical protein
VLELEQEKGEWGFRALKQMIKIYFKLVSQNSPKYFFGYDGNFIFYLIKE